MAIFLALAIQVGLGLISEDVDGLFHGPLYRFVSIDMSEAARDLHEFWFENVIVTLIALHIAAILFYRMSGRRLTKPMITGKDEIRPGTEPMRPGKWWHAVICLVIAMAVSRWVVAGAPPFGT